MLNMTETKMKKKNVLFLKKKKIHKRIKFNELVFACEYKANISSYYGINYCTNSNVIIEFKIV